MLLSSKPPRLRLFVQRQITEILTNAIVALVHHLLRIETNLQGWAPRPAGNPPRGEGGFPAPPAKMIRSAGKWRGKKKVTFSNLSKRGK